jgi:hypothetical protein
LTDPEKTTIAKIKEEIIIRGERHTSRRGGNGNGALSPVGIGPWLFSVRAGSMMVLGLYLGYLEKMVGQ